MHSLRTIYIRLNEIETAIAFAKLKTLHQSLIESDEFLIILHKIEKKL